MASVGGWEHVFASIIIMVRGSEERCPSEALKLTTFSYFRVSEIIGINLEAARLRPQYFRNTLAFRPKYTTLQKDSAVECISQLD